MSFESEAVVLFAAGVFIVLAAELGIALLGLRKFPQARRALLGHSICLLLAVVCVVCMMVAPKAPDGGSYNGSGLLAMAGVLWFAAECFVLGAFINKKT